MIDDKELAEIEVRCESATHGPWDIIVNGNPAKSHAVIAFGAVATGSAKIASGISPKTSNANFIAHSRTDIPALVQAVRQLKEELDIVYDLADRMERKVSLGIIPTEEAEEYFEWIHAGESVDEEDQQ